jgi:23S rRNA maturation-related 3'-5' exoribonuclease YhaM
MSKENEVPDTETPESFFYSQKDFLQVVQVKTEHGQVGFAMVIDGWYWPENAPYSMDEMQAYWERYIESLRRNSIASNRSYIR